MANRCWVKISWTQLTGWFGTSPTSSWVKSVKRKKVVCATMESVLFRTCEVDRDRLHCSRQVGDYQDLVDSVASDVRRYCEVGRVYPTNGTKSKRRVLASRHNHEPNSMKHWTRVSLSNLRIWKVQLDWFQVLSDKGWYWTWTLTRWGPYSSLLTTSE